MDSLKCQYELCTQEFLKCLPKRMQPYLEVCTWKVNLKKKNLEFILSKIKTKTNFGGKKSEFVDLGLDVWSDKQVIENEDCRLNWNYLNSLNESSSSMIKICHKK